MELAQRFDVGDEMRGGVGAQIGIRHAGERPAPCGPTLVEEHYPIGIWIEEAAAGAPAGAPGAQRTLIMELQTWLREQRARVQKQRDR